MPLCASRPRPLRAALHRRPPTCRSCPPQPARGRCSPRLASQPRRGCREPPFSRRALAVAAERFPQPVPASGGTRCGELSGGCGRGRRYLGAEGGACCPAARTGGSRCPGKLGGAPRAGQGARSLRAARGPPAPQAGGAEGWRGRRCRWPLPGGGGGGVAMGTGRAPSAVSWRRGRACPVPPGHPEPRPGACRPSGRCAVPAPAASWKVRKRLSSE